MKRNAAALLAACACLLGPHAYAHHSFPGTYLEDRTVTIQGELVQVLYRNPHSFVQVMVKERDGSVVRYAVEWVGASELGRQGVTAATLKSGDFVVISGMPGCSVKSRAMSRIGLPAAACTAPQRSADTVLP